MASKSGGARDRYSGIISLDYFVANRRGRVHVYMVLLIFAQGNFNIGATKPIFLDSGSPRREGGGSSMRGHGLSSLYNSYTKFK